MAISRSMMDRQLKAGGGIMTLEEPRQGYFLGKIVRKAKRAVKKVVKSPVGKAAILGGLGMYAGGLGPFAKLKGAGFLRGAGGGLGSILSKIKSGEGALGQIGNLFRVGGEAGNDFSVLRMLGGAGIGAAVAAPFLMGGDEEEIDEGTPFDMAQPMVENIRSQARQYYGDPTNSALYFMPPKSAVRSSFYAANGGLASLRPGYRFGNIVQKAGQMMRAGAAKVKSLFDDADINISVSDADVMTDYGPQAQAVGQNVFITPKSRKATKVMDDLIEEGYDITKDADGDYTINALDEGALDVIAKRLRLGDKNVDKFMSGQDYFTGGDTRLMDEDSKMIYNALRDRKADGGLMDLGGLEKDYREGGFVPLGAEERADDVPARLSKNEFVFTADAVRNAGRGDIDKGAEVMQNMMDNLEAGGTISEESQGKNPAQEMFDQSQMLESRIV